MPGAAGRVTPGAAGRVMPGAAGRVMPGAAGRAAPGAAGRVMPGAAGRAAPGAAGRAAPGAAGRRASTRTAGRVASAVAPNALEVLDMPLTDTITVTGDLPSVIGALPDVEAQTGQLVLGVYNPSGVKVGGGAMPMYGGGQSFTLKFDGPINPSVINSPSIQVSGQNTYRLKFNGPANSSKISIPGVRVLNSRKKGFGASNTTKRTNNGMKFISKTAFLKKLAAEPGVAMKVPGNMPGVDFGDINPGEMETGVVDLDTNITFNKFAVDVPNKGVRQYWVVGNPEQATLAVRKVEKNAGVKGLRNGPDGTEELTKEIQRWLRDREREDAEARDDLAQYTKARNVSNTPRPDIEKVLAALNQVTSNRQEEMAKLNEVLMMIRASDAAIGSI
jgi:hypothetical protein